MADLKVNYAGLEFKNPMVAAAGPLGRTFFSLKSSIEAGAGAVSLKSANAKPPAYEGEQPKAHIYSRPAHTFLRKNSLPKMMLNWEGVPVEFTAEKQAEMIRRIKPIAKDHGCKIIANIHQDPMYMEDMDMFKRDIEILLEAEPDLLEACPCPYHLPPEFTYSDQSFEEEFKEFAAAAWGTPEKLANIPYIAKANLHVFRYTHEELKEAGVKNFHVSEGPWFYGSIVDIDKAKPLVPGPGVITYGSHRKPILNNHVARTVDLGDYQVMSSGGVWNANDAIERMMCGSRLVAIHTAVQYHGHKIFGKILNGMSDFLDKKGTLIEDIIGVAQADICSHDAHDKFMRDTDRKPEEIKPVIADKACTKCGTCGACIHGGIISAEDGAPVVDLDLCVRCGICESLCPTGAIELQTV